MSHICSLANCGHFVQFSFKQSVSITSTLLQQFISGNTGIIFVSSLCPLAFGAMNSGPASGGVAVSASGQGGVDRTRRLLAQELAEQQRNSIRALIAWQLPQRESEQVAVREARSELCRANERYNRACQSARDLFLGHTNQLEEMMQLHAEEQLYLGNESLLPLLRASIRWQITAGEPPLQHLQTLRETLQELRASQARLRPAQPRMQFSPNRFSSSRRRERSRSSRRRDSGSD